MRIGIGVLFGFLAGLAAGFLLFEDRTEPERSPRRPAPRATNPAAPRQPPAADHTEESTEPAAGAAESDGLVIYEKGELVAPRPLDEIAAALASARRARDWNAYKRAVLELASHGTPEAQAMLLEIMGDRTLNLEGTWTGQLFYKALRNSDLPGILEAARVRARIDVARDPDSRWRGVGWLSLLALHGGAAELDWIEAQGTGRNWESEIDRALSEGARNPLAAERLAARIADPDHLLQSSHLDAFARENPRRAFEAAVQALEGPRDRQRDRLWRLLGDAATEDMLPAARALVEGIDDEGARLEALTAVDRIARRGLPTAGFEPIIGLPREILAEYAARGLDPGSRADATRLREALNTLRGNPVAWDAETLALVQGLADRVDADLARFVQKTAERMEAGLNTSSGGWQPER